MSDKNVVIQFLSINIVGFSITGPAVPAGAPIEHKGHEAECKRKRQVKTLSSNHESLLVQNESRLIDKFHSFASA